MANFNPFSKNLSFFLLIFFLSNAFSATSQTSKIDSLQTLLQAKQNDTSRLRLMIDLADLQSNINVDSAYSVSLALEELALKQPDKRWLGRAYICKGFVFYRQSLIDLALNYYLKANEIFQETGDLPGISDACNRVALIYKMQKKYKESLSLLAKSLKIRNAEGNLKRISIVLNNIGTVYEHMKDYRSALKYYQKSYKLDSIGKDLDGLSTSSFNEGYIYDQLGYRNLARKKYVESLTITRHFNDKWEIADTWYFLAQSYINGKQVDSAKKYLDASAALASQTNSRELLKKIHLLESDFWSSQKDYKKANVYLNDYVHDFENSYDTKLSRSINDLQHSYDLANKEKFYIKNRLLQEEKFNNQEKMLKGQQLFLAGGAIILILAIALIFVLFRNQKNKQASLAKLKNLNYRVKLLNENLEYKVEERTKELTETKDQIYQFKLDQILQEEKLKTEFNKQMAQSEMKALRAQMNPHFLFNCLNSINRYIIRNDQSKASSYLSKFARLMRLILNNSKQSLIWLEDEVESVQLYMELEQLRFDHKFNFQIIIQPDLSVSDLMVPPMILQPFIENSIWHGFMHSEKEGVLQVKISLENEMIHFIIEDNGIGREKAMAIKNSSDFVQESFGLKISEERMNLLNVYQSVKNRIRIDDLMSPDREPCGTRITLVIPSNLHID